ncbi:MAG: tRNA (N6-threonylcarbamoyladenosine(37)-N6)-methyltransferase TrmO [Rariglobus sp.]|nr:tRNA (N6-threonylcarbamoyladenosine(37)-N6)-methyltransferase TrmO [Rariglobus sp.]
MSDAIPVRPVAILRTPFGEKFGVPRQSGFILEAEGRVEFTPEFSAPDFVRGIEAFSHIWLVTGFHQNPPWTGAATVRPPRLGGNERVGVFASRAPNRPNGLGLSLVRLLAVEAGALRVAGIDAVDGTPVYDIKPYLPWCEARPEATSDWSTGTPFTREETAVKIPQEIADALGETTVRLLRQVLRLDLQPAYQDEPERIYGMALAGWNINWRALPDNAVAVVSVTRLPS